MYKLRKWLASWLCNFATLVDPDHISHHPAAPPLTALLDDSDERVQRWKQLAEARTIMGLFEDQADIVQQQRTAREA